MINNNTTYKSTSIGLIPSDWEVKKLGEIVTLVNGKAYRQEELLDCGKYRVLRVGNLFSNNNWYFSDLELEENKYVSKGDLMYAWSASFGPRFWEDEKIIYHYHIWKILISEKTTKYFIYHLLEYDKEQILSKSQGGTMFHITKGDMENRKLPLPPLPEQQKIASILSTWDSAIDNCKSIIDNLKVRNKGLTRQLLSGKLRIKGFEESKWVEKKGNKIFRNNTDKTHNGDLEILSATQERGVIPRSMNNIDIKYDKSSLGTYKKVEVGDYVISLRSFQGGIEYSEYEGIVSPAYTILKEIIPISKKFYKVYFKTETFINRLNTIIYGIRDGKQISFSDFATLNIPYPSIEEQNEIAIILDKATEELNQYQQKLQTLQLQKKGLMQQLLTGKIRTV
jgi:type I restriction enzyme S subunit